MTTQNPETSTRRTVRQLTAEEQALIAPEIRELTQIREREAVLSNRLGRWLQVVAGHSNPVLQVETGEIYVVEDAGDPDRPADVAPPP